MTTQPNPSTKVREALQKIVDMDVDLRKVPGLDKPTDFARADHFWDAICCAQRIAREALAALDSPAADEHAPDAEGFAALTRYRPAHPRIGGDPRMEQDDAGEYLDRDDVLRAYAAAQPKWQDIASAPVARLKVTDNAFGVPGASRQFIGLTERGQSLPPGNYELYAAPPAKREGGGT